ncbi:MAG: thiamine ABC transporter ATP-binding protein [Hyphomicrobiaceae bacterium]
MHCGYDTVAVTFDAHFPAGAFVALIGPSGAGKSTLLNLIAGFEVPARGRILIGGCDMTGLAPHERPVSMVFQEHNLFVHLDVATNIALGIDPSGRIGAPDRKRIAAALGRVGLPDFEDRLPGTLSGGERQRVAIARALVRDKPVLLLDEPFAALGPALRTDMLGLIGELHRERHMSVVMVTHEPRDARRAASHVGFISEGTLAAFGPPDEVMGDAGNRALAEYLGD